METLETLAVALGFATLAGLNLYLVVLVTGLAINQGWVDVSATYPELAVLGDPLVLAVAGALFCLEFFSDKVPWVDSLWDSVHTLVRPVGGALLAIHTLGPSEPAFEVVVALLAGGTTLVAHGFKSGSRLVINASPEPVSNVAASIAEDVAVLSGLALLVVNPLLAGLLCLAFLAVALYLTPKFYRRFKAFFWLLGHKLFRSADPPDEDRLLRAGLDAEENSQLSAALGGRRPEPLWSAEVVTGRCRKMRGLSTAIKGRIVAESGAPGRLHFLGRRFWRPCHLELDLEGMEVARRSRFLSEDVVIYELSGPRKLSLRLPSGRAAIAERIAESLRSWRGEGAPAPAAEQARIAAAE